MSKVIISKMQAEFDEDNNLFAQLLSPVVVDTMEEAKRLIEEEVSSQYTDNDNYVVDDVTRHDAKDGSWVVTVWYEGYGDGCRAEWRATRVE